MSDTPQAISRYEEIRQDLINLALNRFDWDGLPLGLTSEKMEYMLIDNGQVFAFNDNNNGLLILPCYGTDELNVYGEFTEYNIFGLNGHQFARKSIDDGVRIKNNPLGSNNMSNIEIYAKRLDDIERTQEINLFQQCIPKIVMTDENGKLTAKALVKAIKDFNFAIFTRKSISKQIQNNEVLDTTAPYLLADLQDYKQNIYNEMLTYLGINNLNVDKKERLITDEVNANNDAININLDLMFDLREKACEEINSMFGTNITVKKREVKQIEQDDIDNKATGGE